ncbi:MAG: VCBS repeat-containing protein, partial [Phycisphaerae bacterium]
MTIKALDHVRARSGTVALTGIVLGSLVVLPLRAQPVYNTSPDWVSSDTPYSTGGALVDMDHDGWLDFVVGNGNDIRREKLSVYYNNGDGTFPLTPNWQA